MGEYDTGARTAMTDVKTLTITADDLPPAELKSLLGPLASENGAEVEVVGGGSRSLDPQLAVGVLQLVGTLAVPFVTVLVDQLFKRAPKASLRGKDASGVDVEITAGDDLPAREIKVTVIVEHPNPQLTIHVP
jgi:hypothetical protein